MHLEGATTLGATSGLIYGPSSTTLPVQSRWRIGADAVDVHWTHKNITSVVGVPNQPGDYVFDVNERPATTGGERLEGVQGWGATWSPDANWMLRMDDARSSWNATDAAVRPAAGVSWQAGYPGTFRTQVISEPSLSHAEVVREGQPLVRIPPGGDGSIEGDVWLYLWGANVTFVDHVGRNVTYGSGSWSTDGTATGADPAGTTSDKEMQILALHLERAHVGIEHPRTGGDLLWAADALAATGGTGARFEEAHGLVEGPASQRAVDGQTLELHGRLRLELTNFTDATRLRAEANGDVDELLLDGASLPFAGRAAHRDLPPPFALGMVAIVGAALVAWGAWTFVQRRGTDPLARAERHVLHDHPRRARRELRRFLRQRPEDVNAWFLLGTTWLQQNAPERLIADLEPVTRRLDGPDLASLSFLLATAHARLRRAGETMEWLAGAVRDPAFRERAAVDPTFAFLQDDLRFRRLVDRGSSAYG